MKFEKYLQENLSDQKSEIDASKIWDNVSEKIDFKKKKRRGIIFWFSGLGALALVVIALYTFTNLTNSEPIQLSDDILQNSEKTMQETTHLNKINPTKEIESKIFNNTSKTITSKKTILSPSLSKNENLEKITTSISSSNHTNEETNNATNVNNNLSIFSGKINTPSPSNLDVKSTLIAGNLNPHKKEINFTKALTGNNRSSKTNVHSTINISSIPIIEFSLINDKKEDLKFLDKPIIQKYRAVNTARSFSMGFLSAVGISKKALTSIDPLYEDLRIQTESTLEHFNIATELNYHINAKWSLGTGIDYLSQTEKFEWEGDYVESINGTYVDTIYFSTKTDSMISNATGDYEASFHRNMRTYNQYRFINVPISIRYAFKIKEHDFSIQPKILFNISYKAYGDYLNNFGVPSQLEDLKTDCKIQYQLGLHYHRSIGQLWDLNLGTTMRWAPKTSIGENAIRTEADYKFFNVRIGVSRMF